MNFNVTKDTITFIDRYTLNKGEYKVDKCTFTFSEEYTDDLIKKAIFEKTDGTKIEMVILDNECDIPYEVLNEDNFKLRVYAYIVENDELVLRYSPTPVNVYVREGSYIGSSSEEITPSQFEQYEAKLNEGLQEVANVNIDAEKVENTATITITKRDGTTKSVEIKDGEKGEKGDKGDKGDTGVIENLNWGDINGNIENQEDLKQALDSKQPVGNYATKNEIPDVSGYITKDVNNLTYYTLKTNTGSSIGLTIDNQTYVMTAELKDADGNVISNDTIDLPLETMVIGATYDNETKEIVLTLKNGTTTRFSVADLVSGLQTEITSANKLSADLIDDEFSVNKFVNSTEKQKIDTITTDGDGNSYLANNGTYKEVSGGPYKYYLVSANPAGLYQLTLSWQKEQYINNNKESLQKMVDDIKESNFTLKPIIIEGNNIVYQYISCSKTDDDNFRINFKFFDKYSINNIIVGNITFYVVNGEISSSTLDITMYELLGIRRTAGQNTNFSANNAFTIQTPTSNMHPATKKYVDDLVGNINSVLATLTSGGN